jgi:hypothetical protein
MTVQVTGVELPMTRSSLTTVVAVLFVLAALFNLGAGVAQYGKAELLQGTTNAVSGLGEHLANINKGNPFAPNNDQLRSQSRDLRSSGTVESSKLYLIAFFILGTAVVQVAAVIGVFGRKSWALKLLLAGAICGILVELQDLAEDGFSMGQLIFILIYALAIYIVAFSSRAEKSANLSAINTSPVLTASTSSASAAAIRTETATVATIDGTSGRPDKTTATPSPTLEIAASNAASRPQKPFAMQAAIGAAVIVAVGGGWYFISKNEETSRQLAEARAQQRIAEEDARKTREAMAQQGRKGVPPSANLSAQRSPTSPSRYSKLTGKWHDGGPGCASLTKTADPATFVFRAWYCEADDSIAKPIQVKFDSSLNSLTEVETKLTISEFSDNVIQVSIPKNALTKYGDGLYLSESVTRFVRAK